MKTRKADAAGQKSIVIAAGVEGGVETEVAAQITVPNEGPWAWVVLVAAFFTLGIIDGCCFSYGVLLPDIIKTMKVQESLGALISSIQISVYFLVSPIASALINRFGFRTVCMAGSMISSLGYFAAYFANNYLSLLLFMGIWTGIGLSFCCMAASVIVGFYFEKRRSFAMSAVTTGTSIGTMIVYPLGSVLVTKSGFKNTILVFASMHGLIYFFSLTFRPLLSLTVTQTEEEGNPTRTVTFLPTVTGEPGQKKGTQPTATERMLHAVSNKNFPTASAFFKEPPLDKNTEQQKPSTSVKSAAISRITLQAQGKVNKNQLKQMQSMVSKIQMQAIQDSKTKHPHTEITIQTQQEEEKSWWGKLFNWQTDSPEARPMYRDDAFYQGNVEKLPVYQKSVAAIKEEERTGLEYQLAVSRAIRVDDLQERRGVCTIALRRVMATMLDPTLLKKKSFLLFCLTGFLCYVGVLVPYVFLADRNAQAGIDKQHCTLFVSVISLANLAGRIVFSILASKFEPVYLYSICIFFAGISTIFSGLSSTVEYQYGYSVIFGFCVSTVSGLRSVVIVGLYGLENLTNGTGLIMFVLAFGNVISTPLAGFLKNSFGYETAFIVAGAFITLGGIVGFPLKAIRNCEISRKNTKSRINQKNIKT